MGQGEDWGYSEHNGPQAWHKRYPIAREGTHQSPINIIIDPDRRHNRNNVCCEGVCKETATTSSKSVNHDCLRERMTQDMSLHEQNQNTNNISRQRNQPPYHNHHHQHHNHHHSHHSHHSHHGQHHRHHHQLHRHSHNENEETLDSQGNSPVRGSLSNSSVSSSSSLSSRQQQQQQQQQQSSNLELHKDATQMDEIMIVDDDNLIASTNNARQDNNASMCHYRQSHKKIFLGYPRSLNNLHVTNTGHGWQIDIPKEIGQHTLLTGPPLDNRNYKLAQFHCHWGEDCEHGSEHLINGKSFAAELHFVHWNSTEFDSVEEAAKHKHGLAVLGVLVQAFEGEQNRNKYLDKIIQSMGDIYEPGQSAPIQDHFDIKKLFPANRWIYASYEGSLTTPPLSEVVDWIVFLNPIHCSSTQIESFRRLICGSRKNNLTNNCRPVQPVNERIVNVWTHH